METPAVVETRATAILETATRLGIRVRAIPGVAEETETESSLRLVEFLENSVVVHRLAQFERGPSRHSKFLRLPRAQVRVIAVPDTNLQPDIRPVDRTRQRSLARTE